MKRQNTLVENITANGGLPLAFIDSLCSDCQEKISQKLQQSFEMLESESNREYEVRWYREHGLYPQRISKTSSGEIYLIGDWSWDNHNPDKPETVEPLIRLAKNAIKRV